MKSIVLAAGFLLTANSLFGTDVNEFVNLNKCDKIIDKKIFNICYDFSNKSAKAVYYKLDGKKINDGNIEKRMEFYEEPALSFFYRVKSSDYTNSGYDRGHLAPDADFDYSYESLMQTYSMANVVPQTPTLNRKVWLKGEKYERIVASELGEVNVINIVNYSKEPLKINDKVVIPNNFYKIIYNDSKNFKKCFSFDNVEYINVGKDRLENHQIDCNTIQISH